MPRGDRARQLSDTDAAWLAGFIDGDGAITHRITVKHRDRDRSPGYPTMVCLIQIGQTDRMVLDYIRELTGIGRIMERQISPTNAVRIRYPGTSTHHRWSVGGRLMVQSLLVQIEPYLVIKKEKAKAILADTGKHRVY